MRPIPRFLAGLTLLLPLAAHAACPTAGQDRDRLLALKAVAFEVPDTAARQALALGLLDCLGDPDPLLRDGVAFEGLTTWLRADALDAATRRALLEHLQARLAATRAPADPGFEAPFAALVLSELARTDRVAAWLTPAQRAALVEAAAVYVEGVRDYRGFDADEGWRHGVAHGADLLMQLALNPALDKPQLTRMLDAVASQVAPAGGAYHFGESERLVRPVLFVLQRGLHDEAEWTAWVQRISSPAPLPNWGQAFSSPTGLARRHNTRFFLLSLYAGLRESGSEPLQARLPPVVAALRASS